MPEYYRVAIDGGYSTTSEAWSTGFAVSRDGAAPSQAALNAWAESVMTYLAGASTEAQGLRAQISTVGIIRRVRVYYHTSVGSPAALAATSTGAAATGSGSVALPLQCARVFSLLTGLPGGSYRGRMYWPKITGGPSSSFTDSSVGTSTPTQFATFLSVNAATAPSSTTGRPAVVSLSKGAVTPVTTIRVDNVIDTQRRRSEDLVPTAYTALVP